MLSYGDYVRGSGLSNDPMLFTGGSEVSCKQVNMMLHHHIIIIDTFDRKEAARCTMTVTVTSLGVTTPPLRSTTTPSSGGESLTPASTRPMSTPPWPVKTWSRDKNNKKYHDNNLKEDDINTRGIYVCKLQLLLKLLSVFSRKKRKKHTKTKFFV